MMHCNVNPGAVLLAGEGKWKLGGLNFMEKVIDTTKASPKFTGYSAKFPKAAQPNLDFIAPEAQMHNSMSPLADMFSLGMVLCAIYNEGHSLIESDFNPTVYAKRISELPQRFEKISKHLPKALVEPVRKMISEDVRDRPTSQLFALVLRYKRILPLLLNWYEKSADLSPFVLPSLLTMIHVAENDDFEAYLREPLMKIMTQRKTLQTSVVFVDLIEFFISRLTKTEIEQHILPELFVCFEPVTNKTTLQLCVLECIERLLPSLSSPGVAQEIVAFLSAVRTTDSSMLSCILAINRHLLSERKFGITCPTIASKLLPPLLDALTSPLLGLNDFRLLMDVLRFMLDTIDRQRTCELILRERKSQGGSCSNISTPIGLGRNLPLISMQKPTVDADFMGSDIDDARFSRTSLSDHRHSTGGETSNTRNWLRSNLQLQRLRASGNRSESVLYGLKQRNSFVHNSRSDG
ncbi:SCY1-like protein 2 [Clonorchis sinensis]|uniref:SCY1-like protein 2 n=1 Tax=Clonorchis sinensis TaxID=79923 RepID=G7YGC4_CLOSI|nr:SCY1-like protein 2 [Clonorchis sinensis]